MITEEIINDKLQLLASLRQPECEGLYRQASVEGEGFFRDLLQSFNIVIYPAIPETEFRWGGGLVDWKQFDSYYQFDVSKYEHDFEDYQELFSALLRDTPLAKYETVILNWNSCSCNSYTRLVDFTVFLENWDNYLSDYAFVVTPDGRFVIESWNHHWFGAYSNFPIGNMGTYLSHYGGNVQRIETQELLA
jgi:hypothetical protein